MAPVINVSQNRDLIKDFFGTYNGVTNLLKNNTDYQHNNLKYNAAQMAVPYQMALLQQQQATVNTQNMLQQQLLQGNISPDDYAAAMGTFGLSPNDRAKQWSQDQYRQQMLDLQIARLMDDRKYRSDMMRAYARMGRGSGSGKAGKANDPFTSLPDNRDYREWYKSSKEFHPEWSDAEHEAWAITKASTMMPGAARTKAEAEGRNLLIDEANSFSTPMLPELQGFGFRNNPNFGAVTPTNPMSLFGGAHEDRQRAFGVSEKDIQEQATQRRRNEAAAERALSLGVPPAILPDFLPEYNLPD